MILHDTIVNDWFSILQCHMHFAVLESSRTILKSLVLALRVESLALASWLKSLKKLEDTLFTNYCMFCTNDFKGNNLDSVRYQLLSKRVKYSALHQKFYSMFTLRYPTVIECPVLESSRTSPRPQGSSRTILKSLASALALRLVSLTLITGILDEVFMANHFADRNKTNSRPIKVTIKIHNQT